MTNRLTTAVKGLFAVSVLFVSVASQAQTPGNLYLTYGTPPLTQTSGPGPFTVTAGQNVDVGGWLAPAAPATGGTTPKTTGVDTVVLYNPAFFTLNPADTGSCSNGDACGTTIPSTGNPFSTLLTQSPLTFTIGTTNYAGIIYDAGQLTGQKAYTAAINFVTYNLQVLPGAAGVSTVYYSSEPTNGFTAATLSTATNIVAVDASPTPSGSALVTQAAYNPNAGYGGAATTFTNGFIQFQVTPSTPAPPSLLLFAAGTIPALRMMRRKRRA